MKLAREKQMSSIKYSTKLLKLLKAKTAVPYACDLCYFGDLYFANELHMSDKEKYANYVKQTIPNSEVIIMNPDDEIEIKDGKITTKLSPPEFTKENLSSYAVMMRPKYEQAMLEEKKYLFTLFTKQALSKFVLIKTDSMHSALLFSINPMPPILQAILNI